ncbi:MAG: flagellar basal body L-ring protein FlgH [Planctomycetes bacterium]|nr:flagellar basal body L-ring protein FlgH [Planctomycetota bacterium]
MVVSVIVLIAFCGSHARAQEPLRYGPPALTPPPPADGDYRPFDRDRRPYPPRGRFEPLPPPDAMPPGAVPPGAFPPEGAPPGDPTLPAPLPPPVPPPGFGAFERPWRLRDYSLLYIDSPAPREIQVNDIVTIIVKEQSRLAFDNRYNRNRNAILKAELKEFLRLGENFTLENAADNQPTIDSTLTSRLQSTGQVSEREELIYRIAATVVDVKPNGNLELSARKSIVTNDDLMEYELSGTVRAQDVNRDNTVLSENIADSRLIKRQRGKVFDSTKRPWGLKLYDWLFPF